MLADTVVLTGNILGYHFAVTLGQFVYLAIAAIVGIVAEFIVGWRLPLGVVGAIIAALVGIWLTTNVFILNIPADPVFYGVPLFRALIGAVVLVGLWHLITYRSWGHRRRYA